MCQMLVKSSYIYIYIYLTFILRGRAGYELIYITIEAVGRVGYYQLMHGVCRRESSFSWRVSPSKFVFMACVALEVRFHGVCRLQKSFS